MAVLLIIFVGTFYLLGVTEGCLNGYTQHDGHCYHYSHDTETWADAMVICRLEDGYLAEIESGRENNFTLSLTDGSTATWLGGTDLGVEGEWTWANSRKKLQYKNWGSGEPNNGLKNENCLEMGSGGAWNDGQCHELRKYICEIPLKMAAA